MTGVENFFIYWQGGIIWDRGGTFSKIINPRSHRGTWTGCINSVPVKILKLPKETINEHL